MGEGNSSASRYMLSGLIRHKAAITLATVITVVSAFLTTYPSVLLGDAVDELTTGSITPRFTFLVWVIVLLGIAYLALYFIVGYVWATVTLGWERDARQEFFEALQDYSMTFHDQVDSKRLLSVAMQDINWVRMSLNPALRNLMFSMASFGLTGVLLAGVDLTPGLMGTLSIPAFILPSPFGWLSLGPIPIPVFTLLIVIGTPLYLILAYRYADAVESVRRERSEDMEQLTSISQSVFRGIEVVRAFGAEAREKEKFSTASKEYQHKATKEGRLAAFYLPSLVLTGVTALAFTYGGYAVMQGTLTVGTLTQVLTLLVGLQGFNFMLPRMLLMIRGGYVNAKRIVDLLSWRDPMTEPEDEEVAVNWSGDIVFDNVSFTYENGGGDKSHYALRDFSLRIPGGSRVALIGGPGGGKSTILKLLMRLYDPTAGSITIDGVDLRRFRTKTVRSNVGLVEQDIFLFRDSVKNNIAFGRSDASMDEIVTAAKRAQAHEFIVELPNQYDSVIGERGMTLSGGQKQRIAIARAIVQDPRILLLDDSVSAVDANTEYLLRKALDEVMVNRTSITVTQRLRTLIESDLIVIVDKGRLVASGTHEELIGSSEHYCRIFQRLPGAQDMLKRSVSHGGVC
ncbi:MAG: ABC transporter ATP-binding protein [Candidatus Thorarchaeota archaeon]|nr:ABC transporter ATP-binding protein [Candidatus Thorarchaeota archaeon]